MFCSSPGQTYFISLFGGEIRSALDLSHGQFGSIYSAATLLSAFLLLRTGSLIDRFPLHKVAICVSVSLALGGVLLSQSYNVFMLFIAVLLLRHFGQGLTSMTASTTMMRHLSEHKAKANALSTMGYSASEAIMPSIIFLLITLVSWRTSWLFIGVGLVIIVPCLSLLLLSSSRYKSAASIQTSNPDDATPVFGDQRQWTRSEVIRDPFFYLYIPGLMSNSMLYTGFMFHQIHLVESKGWALSSWAGLYVLFSITSMLTMLSVGSLSDKIGAIRLAPWASLPVGIGLLILSSSDNLWVAAAFMVLMAISTGAQGALASPFFAERYGNKNFASIKSLGAFAMMIMTASSPILLGWLIDRGFTINTLAASSAVYAFIATLISYSAYRVLSRQ